MDFLQLLRITVLGLLLDTCLALPLHGSAVTGTFETVQAHALDDHPPRIPHGRSTHMRREAQLDPTAADAVAQVVGAGVAEQPAAGLVAVAERKAQEPEDTTTPAVERPQSIAPEEAHDKVVEDGIVEVYHPAYDDSQVIRLEEESNECMMDSPVWQCMEKFGSYGIRRLFTDSTDDFDKLKNWRKDWMSHDEVQKRRLYDLVWPGSHDSGSYGFDEAVAGNNDSVTSVRGALTQSLDTFTQLKMGVRAFDIQVATGVTNGELYTANGFLMTPLSTFLTDIASFLEQHKEEVLILMARKADVWNGITTEHIRSLRDQETDPTMIPGESVHRGVDAIIGGHLATHEALKKIKEDPTNPKIEACIMAGIRVFYFWEGQQVLCIDHERCSKTPGWQRGNLGKPWAFGPPMAPGARSNLATGMTGNSLYLEPSCIMDSTFSSGSGNPFQLFMNVKEFTLALMDHAKKFRPTCFASDGKIPDLHQPTLLYKADAYVTPHTDPEGSYKNMYIGIKEIFTKGEAMTLRSEAERTNYLLLMWLLRKNWRPLYTKLNIISTDYVAPAVIQRLIEANQNSPDCGYAVHCKPSGSCWAMTRLDEDGQTCLEEEDVRNFLKAHADAEWINPWLLFLLILLGGFCCKLMCCSGLCFLCGNKPYPSLTRENGVGVMWWKRQPAAPKKEEKVEEEPAEGEADAEAEANGDGEFEEEADVEAETEETFNTATF